MLGGVRARPGIPAALKPALQGVGRGLSVPRRAPAPAKAFDLGTELQTYITNASQPNPGLLYGSGVNSLVFALGYGVLRKGLTVAGVAHSWFLGTSVYAAFGFGGHLLVCLYFLLGTLVTKVKMKEKQAEGIAEARGGQRGPASVWGSGLAAVICAWAAMLTQDHSFWQIGFVASIASKLSDTVSSEIGKAYGKTTYLITSFKLVPRGTEGAVSLEGSAAGIVVALGFAGAAMALGQVDAKGAVLVTAAAVVANTFESFLGAMVQGDVQWLTNDVVNMLQICVAAALAVGAQMVLC